VKNSLGVKNRPALKNSSRSKNKFRSEEQVRKGATPPLAAGSGGDAPFLTCSFS
jgi:hypothetical protein